MAVEPTQLLFNTAVMPRPIRPITVKSDTIAGKVVDYMMKDGPTNRYALICSNCHGHNGMALPSEFEFIQYYCVYCCHNNAARKLRPLALAAGSPSAEAEPLPLAESTSQRPNTEPVDEDKDVADEREEHAVAPTPKEKKDN